MRARTFWIALVAAIVFALWLGPGLAAEDEMPPPSTPTIEDPGAVTPAAQLPECEDAHDPGPDGDR